jgi:glycerophosphoryl diester phosphodiesterase
MHDPDVDRTTSGYGPLSGYTFDRLRALDAGGWFAPEYAGEQVPTFEEFIDVIEPAPTKALVELKGEWPVDKVAEVISLLRSHNMVYRVVLSSFERDTLEAVRELAPEYATILLTRELDDRSVEYAVELKVSGVCARDTLLAEHPRAIERLREEGIGTIAYTLNSKKQWNRALGLGVDFFVTDDPPALAAWREAIA